MNFKINKKGFTIIELLVVIAILGILTLLAGSKFLGYVQKTELTRIQHDVKIMENKMDEVLAHSDNNFLLWENNGKDLGTLILRNQLLEREGLAKRVSIKHLLSQSGKSANPGKEKVGMGGELYEVLGGGEEQPSITDPSASYKIIPETFKKQIGTSLDGTFYVNKIGKVYYEPNKPFSSIKQEQVLACVSAETLDYEFDSSTGTIIKYHGALQYINIPSAFEVDGKCVPVRIIGKGAFMRGDIKFEVIKIPQSVKGIEEDAFRDNNLTEVEIPNSVDNIGSSSFAGNKIKSVVINKSPEDINIGSGAFSNNGPTGTSTVTPTYKTPTVEDLGIVFNKSTGTIVGSSGGSGGLGGSGGGGGVSGGGSGSSGGATKNYDNFDRVISIPEKVIVDGEEHEIKEIAKGAFQGQGIVYIELPNTLKRIGDYAFAGNQLIGIDIPPSVSHIGNYAFAFNELNKELTMEYVKIASEEQMPKINNLGNVIEHGEKVDLLKNKVNLLNHIFVTSTGNVVIEEEYIGENGGELVDNWITIQKWTQLIDAGGQGAIWLNSNIQDNIPDGTRIIYGYTTSDDQLTWSSESENIEDTPSGRYLKINIETQRLSSVSEVPRIINISPIYQIQNKVVQTESITKYNEKIDFTQYNNIIYVDFLNGSDSNPGTLGQPLRNIDVAYNKASNGDLLYLNEGIHTLKVATLTKKVDFYGLSKNTTLVFNGPYQRPFNAGNGYLGINPSADSGFYNMIIETRGSSTYANFFYNKGALAFYNVVFNNFFNLDYTDFVIMEKGSLYLYNVVVTDSAARNLFVRLSTGYEGTLLLQNLYGKLTLDNIHSPRKIDLSVLKDSRIVSRAQLDVNFNILEQNWKNVGLGVNPDGSQANIGVYGGPNSWEQ